MGILSNHMPASLLFARAIRAVSAVTQPGYAPAVNSLKQAQVSRPLAHDLPAIPSITEAFLRSIRALDGLDLDDWLAGLFRSETLVFG